MILNFLKIKEYFLKTDEILYIKEIGAGIRIVCKFGTIDIANIDAAELANIYAKLNLIPLPLEGDSKSEPDINSKEDTPEINCIWSHCRMCSHFCMTTDYTLRPGVLKVRCAKYGFEDNIEEEAMDVFGPDDWR